ncbi:MAG: thiamine-monophosphate kinase, partial [Verrucomicrobia bacterium]|nr:thiamine-monophosphate kinase [Verrucomicrobiota bacterium]
MLSDLGEWGLIERLKPLFSDKIGDDCAVVPMGHLAQLFTTDLLIEHRHFTREMPPYDLGYKALAVNLSDIAAMGGIPKYALLAGALPDHLKVEWAMELLRGFAACANKYEVEVIGGDTCGSNEDIMLSVTAIGEMELAKVRRRSDARLGDAIVVMGELGRFARSNYQCVVEPQIALGRKLADNPFVHAMMDLSDGLASDLPRIAEASRCGFEVELGQLDEAAVCGGEDYC